MKRKITICILLIFTLLVFINQLNIKKTKSIDNVIETKQNDISNVYTINLEEFKIKNDGTSAIETSKGINEALQFAKQKGYEKVIFPKGTYLIDEKNQIALDMKNMIIDLNGSIFQINTNGLEGYGIVAFKDGAENVRLINGHIRGDKDTHDYNTIKGTHEWGSGVVFEGGNNLEMNNVTISNATGYGINVLSGTKSNRFDGISTKDLEMGTIDLNGKNISSNDSIRSKIAYDISKVGKQFELGYTVGYQGYPTLKNKEYTSYFYDKNMNFLNKKECLQYRKVDIPQNSTYVKFVFPQKDFSQSSTMAAWISNFKPPTNVKLKNCVIKENRTLGIAFCGGQKWLVENNSFEGNGGNAPGYAIDLEDGWGVTCC